MEIILKKSDKEDKKFMVNVDDKKIYFGASGYSDFLKSGDEKKKKAYLARHKVNEDWKKSGIKTAGFWARWVLWNKPFSIKDNIKDIEKRFNIKIKSKL